MSVVVISPHIDDAALSLAGTLKMNVQAGRRVHIINCFTQSSFAPFRPDGNKTTAIAHRKSEDERFMQCLGGDSSSEYLGLPDAPIRTGLGLRGIMGRDPALPDIAKTIERLSACLPDLPLRTDVFVPLALGVHRDHFITREAAIARYRDCRITFFEDMPYATRACAGEIDEAVREASRSFGKTLAPTLTHWDGDVAWKHGACSVYETQLAPQTLEAILDYMRRTSGERRWGFL